MKRFYRDPLAAAWMATHFGMEFDFNDFDGPIYVKCREIPLSGNYEHMDGRKTRFFIYPESLHLLTPNVGDLIAGNWSSHFVENRSDRKQASDLIATAGFRIIQRDGKPFHWPESEAE